MQAPLIFQNPDLDGSTFYWPKGGNAILCLHGFTATTVEVRTIAGYFGDHGFTTGGPLLPGHGTTLEDANKKTWKDWVNAAEDMYLMLKENHNNVFILGESVGGLLALYLAAKYKDVPGLMLCAPALVIPHIWRAKLLHPFVKYTEKKYVKNSNEEDYLPWQGYNFVPVKATASLASFQQIVKKELSNVTAPVIIFQGKKDTTIDPLSSVIVLSSVNSSQKELVWLPESRHVILLDRQLADVEEMCLTFISGILEGHA